MRDPPEPVSSSQNPSSVRLAVRWRSRCSTTDVTDTRLSRPVSSANMRYSAQKGAWSCAAHTIPPVARSPPWPSRTLAASSVRPSAPCQASIRVTGGAEAARPGPRVCGGPGSARSGPLLVLRSGFLNLVHDLVDLLVVAELALGALAGLLGDAVHLIAVLVQQFAGLVLQGVEIHHWMHLPSRPPVGPAHLLPSRGSPAGPTPR